MKKQTMLVKLKGGQKLRGVQLPGILRRLPDEAPPSQKQYDMAELEIVRISLQRNCTYNLNNTIQHWFGFEFYDLTPETADRVIEVLCGMARPI